MNIYKFKLVMSENNFQPVIRPRSQLTKPYPEGKDSNSFLPTNGRSENWASPLSSATLPAAFSTCNKQVTSKWPNLETKVQCHEDVDTDRIINNNTTQTQGNYNYCRRSSQQRLRGARVSSVVQVHLPAECPNFLQRVPAQAGAHTHTPPPRGPPSGTGNREYINTGIQGL